MRASFHILGSDGHSSGCVVLVLNDRRFLFDVPEGTQRYCTECKVKMIKVQGAFLTRTHPDTFLGLPGLLLTLREIERTRSSDESTRSITQTLKNKGTVEHAGRTDQPLVKVVGPDTLGPLIESTEPFVKCPNFFEVETVSDCTVVYKSSTAPHFTISALCENGVVSYRLDIPEQPGKFMAEKAKQLGVNGPNRAKLKRGESVESESQPGRMVLPSEVLGDAIAPTRVVIVASAMTPKLQNFFTADDIHAKVVFHLTNAPLQTAAYRQCFLDEVGCATHYFATARAHTVFYSSALQHDRLAAVAPKLFPRENTHWEPERELPAEMTENARHKSLENSALIHVVADTVEVEHYQREVLDLCAGRVGWPKELCAEVPVDVERQFPNLTLLGTGGMMPSKYRNVTSMLLECTAGEYILLDAGEGSIGQLRRCRDVAGVLKGLKLVWVSHIHADHHLGLATILHRRAALHPHLPPVTVVGPIDLKPYLEEFAKVVPLSYTYSTCSTTPLVIDAITLESVLVDHCGDSWGCVVQSNEWKIVNSGDTRPCEALISAGKGCDLLIHEATFEDEKQEDAEGKKHSTVTEALDVARRMESKQTVLTHFSQRYPKVPPKMDHGDASSAALGFDMMTLTALSAPELRTMNSRLPILESYYTTLEEAKKATSAALLAKAV